MPRAFTGGNSPAKTGVKRPDAPRGLCETIVWRCVWPDMMGLFRKELYPYYETSAVGSCLR